MPKNTSDGCFPWMSIGNIPLRDCLTDPCFVIKRVDSLPERVSTGPVIRIHISCDRSKGKPHPSFQLLQSGFVDLDTKNHYRPLAYEYTTSNPKFTNTRTGEIDYLLSEGIPIIRSMTLSDKGSSPIKGIIIGTEATTYQNVRYNSTVDNDQFWLSYYQLPEPVGLSRSKSVPNYVWLLFGCGTFGLFAVLFGYLKRRSSSAALMSRPA